MHKLYAGAAVATLCVLVGSGAGHAAAITGQLQGAGAPIASSMVTLWAASAGDP